MTTGVVNYSWIRIGSEPQRRKNINISIIHNFPEFKLSSMNFSTLSTDSHVINNVSSTNHAEIHNKGPICYLNMYMNT
jgi:hypothetical protein